MHVSVHSAKPGKLTELCFNSVVNFSLHFGTSSDPVLCCLSLPRDTAFCRDSGSCWHPVVLVSLVTAQSTLTVWTTQLKSELEKATKSTQEHSIPHL